jgi:hypothetical protein
VNDARLRGGRAGEALPVALLTAFVVARTDVWRILPAPVGERV